jgi:hypothetical protein
MNTIFFFYVVLNSCGAIPVLKCSIISAKYSSATLTKNNYASRNLSSKLVGSSPLMTLDK